jgi:hypothetical protein
MSSIDIRTAKLTFKGGTESETLQAMAKAYGCRLIYKYANDFGDKVTPTDYKVVMAPGDAQDRALFSSPYAHHIVLVYQDGKVLDQKT